MISWIRVAVNLFKECNHEKKFLIPILSHVGLNRDTIVELISEWDNWVVNDNDIFQITIFDHTQIFYVYTIAWVNTMLTVKSMLYDLTIWINEIETGISIVLGTSCEYANLVVPGQEVKSHVQEWS